MFWALIRFPKYCARCPIWLFLSFVVFWFHAFPYIAQALSKLFWSRSSFPYYYWYHFCFYIPHELYCYCKVFSSSKKLTLWQITGGTEVENGLALPILNFGARCGWVVKATPREIHPQEAEKIPFVQEAERVPGNVWMSVKITSLSKLDPNTVQLLASRCIDSATPAHWKVVSVINSSYIFLFEFKVCIFSWNSLLLLLFNFLCMFCD